MHRRGSGGFNGMMNFGNNGWFILYDVVKLLILVAVVIFIVRIFIKRSNDNKNNKNSNKAIEILKVKYASGEITEEEYKHRLKNIE